MESDFAPWERFIDWVHSICVVTFDLELGQALEVVYPGDAVLSSAEKTNICYLAFPDSNSGNSKDTNFHFRIRRSHCHLSPTQRKLLDQMPPCAGMDHRYMYGFVHFRQQKDSSIPRGYYQKSVVLMSILPFFNLFSVVIERIATQFFISGEPAIESACHDMDHWPLPVLSLPLSLPLLGMTIRCRLPCQTDVPFDSRINEMHSSEGAALPDTLFLPNVYQIDIYKPLNTTLNHVQLLWELVLIGEPLLVMASSPSRCSLVVQSLVALIAPLKHLNDFRPFFTIHDSEFKEYSSRSRTPPKAILGVTNPFFTKALEHWPHILKVSDVTEGEQVADKQDKTRKNWDGRTLDSKPGLYTQYKPFLTKDKLLTKKVMKADRPDEVQSALLRRYFLELTQSFMIPLERYLFSLMPFRKEMNAFKSIPSTRPFSIEDFLSSIESSGPSLTCGVKGDWAGLYRRFVSSSNFIGWLSNRTKDMNSQLQNHFDDVLCSADLGTSTLSTKHHVEIVDLVLRIRQRVLEMETSNEKRALLVKQIVCVLGNVDEELKQVLMSNCALREIVI